MTLLDLLWQSLCSDFTFAIPIFTVLQSLWETCVFFFSISLVESVIPMLLRNFKSWTYWCQGSLLHGVADVHDEVALCLGQRFDNGGPHVWGDGQRSVGQLSA